MERWNSTFSQIWSYTELTFIERGIGSEVDCNLELRTISNLWLEAEQWAPGEWIPADGNTDVIVTFDDASRWVATFFSYDNIQTLTEKNRRTVEDLAGAYFWASDMILVDNISCPRIEEAVRHLIQEGEFETIFTRLPPANDEANELPLR
jgi:hypothetical protein